MKSKYLNLIVHDAASLVLNVSIFYVTYTINQTMAVFIAGLYVIKTVANFLYVQEKKNEDKEMMEEFDKLLKIKDSDNV